MKKYIAIALALLVSITANAQDRSQTLIRYTFRFMPDSLTRTQFIEETVGVWISGDKSLYMSYPYYVQDSLFRDRLKTTESGGMISVGGNNMPRGAATRMYRNQKQPVIIIFDKIITNYKIEDKIGTIPWQLQKETKMIGAYRCQKAIGKFRGRVYEVWFANELPAGMGPWKLGGLPGTILEASDSRGEVFFNFQDISAFSSSRPFEEPLNAAPVSLQDFKKLIKTYQEDPVAFVNASSGGKIAGGTFIPNNNSNTTQRTPPRKANNAIELVQ